MLPVLPHLASECLEKLDNIEEIKWPNVDKEYISSDKNIIVIQVNGKKRATISVKKDMKENDILELIKKNKIIEKYAKDKKIIKTIYVKNRLINYIVN